MPDFIHLNLLLTRVLRFVNSPVTLSESENGIFFRIIACFFIKFITKDAFGRQAAGP